MTPRVFLLALLTLPLAAHPMGNFSVSHYTRIEPSREGIKLLYALDLAELPSFEMLQKWKLSQDAPERAIAKAAVGESLAWVDGLDIRIDGKPVRPNAAGAEVHVGKGAGNMAVIRVEVRLVVVAVRGGKLEFEDRNFPDRNGWREIVVGDAKDLSKALTDYPADPNFPAPQSRRATVAWDATGAVKSANVEAAGAGPEPRHNPGAGSVIKGDYLSELLSKREISLATLLAGLAVAFVLGAMHAATPGHGKTMVAAYLVGERGTPKHAVILGTVTTFTHTAVVFLLGIGTYLYAGSVVPESVTQTLGVISGLSIVGIGGWLLYQRLPALIEQQGGPFPGARAASSHSHDHGDSYDPRPVSNTSLIALGASGGLVPCPSALVLLLSALAIGRVGFGLVLLVAFSLGLASVLIATGLVTLYAKSLLPAGAMSGDGPLFRYLPVVSAAAIVAIGCVMTAVAVGWVRI